MIFSYLNSIQPEKIFQKSRYETIICVWAVVVAQLEERSLPTLVVRSSDPVISKLYVHSVNCIEKSKINRKRLGIALGQLWRHHFSN